MRTSVTTAIIALGGLAHGMPLRFSVTVLFPKSS
jgi:hypothetical protein